MLNHPTHAPQATQAQAAQSSRSAGMPGASSTLPEQAYVVHRLAGIRTLPDLHGLLLVALAAAWLAGILCESRLALPLWLLLPAGGGCVTLALLLRWLELRTLMSRWLLLSLLLLSCAAFGAGRLALSSPANDPTAVSSFIGRGPVTIRGSISAEPALRAHSILLEVDASRLRLDNAHTWQETHGTVAVLMPTPAGPYPPEYGDTVELHGPLEPVANSFADAPANPSPANQATSPAKHVYSVTAPAGIFAAMSFPRLLILERGGGNPILAWLFRLRQQLAQAISQSLPEPEASLLIGILLGLKTPVLRAQYQLFQASGTVHLVVTSGFKVTVLSGMLAALARRVMGRRWALGVVLAGIGAYTILSGAGPAAIRAGIMGAVLAIAPQIGRSYNLYTSLAFAALVMSAWSPYMLWDVGFQLSMLGTLGIALLVPLMMARLEHRLSRVPIAYFGAELIAVTLAAQIATLPIQAITFGQLSLVAPLANLLAVPFLGTLLGIGVLVGLLGLAAPAAGALAGWVCWPLLWLVYQIIARSAVFPFASLAIGALDLRLAWLYYAALGLAILGLLKRSPFAVSSEHPRPIRAMRQQARRMQAHWRLAGVLLVILAACLATLATLPNPRLRIAWLDTGPRGQAILLQTPGGHTALIDGGADPAALETALSQQLPFWHHSIDLALLTNPRSGHLLGLIDATSHYHIRQAADAGTLHPSAIYTTWRATLEQRQIPYARIRQGVTIQLEPGILLQVLSPGPTLSQDPHHEDTNALILRLVTPTLRVLLLGETDELALSNLAARGSDLHADIVQIALRPDQSPEAWPTLAALLPVIQPALIVVTPASAITRAPTSAPPPPSETLHTLSVATTGTLTLTAQGGHWWLEQ